MRSIGLVTSPFFLLLLGASGGAIASETSADDSAAAAPAPGVAHVATGLWVAHSTVDPTRFSVLQLCADGTLGHGSPDEPLPVGGAATCARPSGTFRSSGEVIVLEDGAARHDARLAADTLVVDDSGEVYHRAAPASAVDGTFVMQGVVSDSGDGAPVTSTRHARFESNRFRFDNELARRGTADVWTTVAEGSYDVVVPGLIDMTADGATRRAHVVTFGPSGAFLHIEGVGYLARQ